MNTNKFWVEDFCNLFKPNVFPTGEMSKTEKLNALTRLSILISAVLYFMKYEYWFLFLVLSLLVIVILYYSNKKKIENFSIVPTYSGTDFQQTIVTPTFSEEWQIPPPAYDIYTQVPDLTDTFDEPLKPQSYPYGQYLTRTNLLPSDEYYTHQGCGGARSAREYINSTFLRHDLAEKENMMRIYKKKLNRRFRHNCQDTYSPYHSY